MEKYRYDTYIYDTEGFYGGKVDEKEFNVNRRGADGWELVSSISTNQANGYQEYRLHF